MQKSFLTSMLAIGAAMASLTSCSRADYAFNSKVPAYLGTERVHSTSKAVVSEPVLIASTEAPAPALVVSPARAAAASLAHHATAPAASEAISTAATAAHPSSLTRAERKELKQTLRQVGAKQKNSPKATAADGKSQTTALILCILLGGIGVHQFYLGYTGRGILRIALALTSFLIVPAIVNLVLYVLDIIKIVNGDLKPKGGEYAQKFSK